jgi:hypothetical protein
MIQSAPARGGNLWPALAKPMLKRSKGMTKKIPNTNTTSVNQAMTLWREWGAAKHGVAAAIDGPNEKQACQRWGQAEEAIINLSDATPAFAIVKLAVRLDFADECETGDAAVHSAYNELKAITGLDPIAELNEARA